MVEEAIDTVFVEWEEMKLLSLALMRDKVDGEKRRDGASCVNLVSRFDKKNDWVKVTCIGI